MTQLPNKCLLSYLRAVNNDINIFFLKLSISETEDTDTYHNGNVIFNLRCFLCNDITMNAKILCNSLKLRKLKLLHKLLSNQFFS